MQFARGPLLYHFVLEDSGMNCVAFPIWLPLQNWGKAVVISLCVRLRVCVCVIILASFNESTESIEQEPEQDSPNENDTSVTSDTQTETDDGVPEDDDSCVLPKPALRFAYRIHVIL